VSINTELYQALRYRSIGPTRGGRAIAVAGDPSDKRVFYFGSGGGGVWKTADGGGIWENVSDGFFKTASVGALAVSLSDPNVVYAGMGETAIRGNVSRGDGVYRSTDAGRTWEHLGLENTQNIGQVLVHPENPEVVYVAAFGHVWGPNPERGLYRSKDGGLSWERLLYRDERTGAVDLAMDPANPRILYATLWQAQRMPYGLSSGGPGCGLFRSFDGGDSWEEITGKPGLPSGLWGKSGVAVASKKPGRVWAIVEAENDQTGLYRSEDYGDNWKFLTSDANLIGRPWYYTRLFADPRDPDTLWLPNFELWKSVDGGATFRKYPIPHVDVHRLWIDPADPDRLIAGHDGGATVSFNGGLTWSSLLNQPTGEFYHVTVDNRFPYRVYGAQQDNSTLSIPSRSSGGAINLSEWREVGGGESGYIAVHPEDPNIVFAGQQQGYLSRYDDRTRLETVIAVWPEDASGWAGRELKYRFNWTSPIVIDPHDPSVLYNAGNRVFRSTDQGMSWEAASDDLTRADPETLGPSGGPITKDMAGTDVYATIFALAVSPVEPGVLWAGSDDGLIQLSRDNGQTWKNVNPPELPDWALVSIIEPSPHDGGTVWVAATCYKLHDDRPYLFKTTDYGVTWHTITNGIPEHEFTRVIREDPVQPGLLYAGTERGLYVSFNAGADWLPLQLNLPAVPVHDLVVHADDLVVATHGRSFWVLDDLTPLRELAQGIEAGRPHLFRPRDTIRFVGGRTGGGDVAGGIDLVHPHALLASVRRKTLPNGETEDVLLDAGNNPPDGVLIRYWLPEVPEEPIRLRLLDQQGNEVRAFDSAREEGTSGPVLPAGQGANQFVWNFRYPDAPRIDDDPIGKNFVGGPKVPPGVYQAELTVSDRVLSQTFQVLADPRTGASQEGLEAQFQLQRRIQAKIGEIHQAVNRIRSARTQIEVWRQRLDREEVSQAADRLKEQLLEIESNLIQVKAKGPKDRLKFPVMENQRLHGLVGAVASAEGRPPRQCYDLFAEISGRVDRQLARLEELMDTELVGFNNLVRESAADPIQV
jgi:photosystem II stability/assembly factor-like uncharacterized protein